MNHDIPQRYLFPWNLFTFVISTLLALPKTYTIPALTPIAMFWAHKLLYFFFIDVFHGIIIPLNMLIPWDIKPSKVGEFYVRKPQITPRRPPFEESRHQIISVEDEIAAISEELCSESKILKAWERAELYDNPQPSTSYQLPQVDCSPKLRPKPFQSCNFKFISSSLSRFQGWSIGMLMLKKEEDALLFIVGRVQRKKRAREGERGKGNCFQSFIAWESSLII